MGKNEAEESRWEQHDARRGQDRERGGQNDALLHCSYVALDGIMSWSYANHHVIDWDAHRVVVRWTMDVLGDMQVQMTVRSQETGHTEFPVQRSLEWEPQLCYIWLAS